MSFRFEEPIDDSYDAFVASCVRDCRCCECCRQVPCAGAMAGGICDRMRCTEDDDRYEDHVSEYDDE